MHVLPGWVSMIALGGPKLKPTGLLKRVTLSGVSMIALGGPKLKLHLGQLYNPALLQVSMIALGGPKLKLVTRTVGQVIRCFNDSTGWA